LRHLAVIPLGGNNITSDICSLQIEEEDAENLKLKHGCAYTERKPGDVEKNLLVNNIRTIEEKVLMEIVETRQEEILNNVLNQIRNSGFEDGLQTGLVISGGASNMMQLEKAIAERIHPEKTRFVKLLPITMINDGIDGVAKDGTMNILLALLNEGNMNCVEPIPEEIPEQADENPIEENIEVQEEIVEQNPTQEDVVEEDVNESELNHTEIDEQEEDSSEEEEKIEKTPKESAFKRWFKRVLDTVSEE
jgi:cell division protein FtsA